MATTYQRPKSKKSAKSGKGTKSIRTVAGASKSSKKKHKDDTPPLPMDEQAMTPEERLTEMQTLALEVEAREHKVEAAKENLKAEKGLLASARARLETEARTCKQGKLAFNRAGPIDATPKDGDAPPEDPDKGADGDGDEEFGENKDD